MLGNRVGFDSRTALEFSARITGLGREARGALCEADFRHLLTVSRTGHAFTLAGYATAWLAFNPLSALLISVGTFIRWIVFHHVNHRGYDCVPGIPQRYLGERYAKGTRRYADWLDWIVPEAWEHEHVLQHHGHVGERHDPDLVERNLSLVRKSGMPLAVRLLVVGAYILTWRLTYYAPKTLMILQNARSAGCNAHGGGAAVGGTPSRDHREFWRLWNPFSRRGGEFWRRCVLPYGMYRFLLIPSAFFAISPTAALNVLLTSLLAEALTNIHSFMVIGPNHTGDDLYRFDTPGRGGAEYHLRQVLGTANFTTGGIVEDFLQGWLNYQIEHHLWQDLPMSAYAKLQPEVRNLCEQMRIPYVQENVWKRVRKTLDIMVGRTSMKRASTLVTADGS